MIAQLLQDHLCYSNLRVVLLIVVIVVTAVLAVLLGALVTPLAGVLVGVVPFTLLVIYFIVVLGGCDLDNESMTVVFP